MRGIYFLKANITSAVSKNESYVYPHTSLGQSHGSRLAMRQGASAHIAVRPDHALNWNAGVIHCKTRLVEDKGRLIEGQ